MKPTLESVLRQKAKGTISIEHVVVDGASTDGTPEWLAEQLAAGNIERYVSEPDRGIYDAMNKGINLARGRVLAFLNAGDTYTDEDLVPCVLPICRGETESVAACAYRIDSSLGPFYKPNYSQLFFYRPCCHQTYFASARAYREIGGYDSRNIPGAAVSPPQPYGHCPDFSITKPAKPFNIACTHEPAHCQYCYPRVQRRQIPAARVGQPVGPNLRGLGGSLHRRRLHGRLCRRVGGVCAPGFPLPRAAAGEQRGVRGAQPLDTGGARGMGNLPGCGRLVFTETGGGSAGPPARNGWISSFSERRWNTRMA